MDTTHNLSEAEIRTPSIALRPSVYALIILAILFIGIRIIRFSEPMALDQGLFAYFGQHILEGEIPYKDIWDSKPPAIFYIYAMALSLGDAIGWVYLLEGLCSAATALLVYHLGRRLSGARMGITAAFAYVLFSHAPMLEGFWANAQAERFMELPILGSLILLFTQNPRKEKALLLASGALAGIAILFKLVACMIIPCAFLYVILSRKGARDATRGLSVYLIGAAVPLIAAMGYFWSQGALGAMWEALVIYKWTYAQEVARGRDLWHLTGCPYLQFAMDNKVFWALSLIGCVALLIKRSPLSFSIVLWYFASFVMVWMQRQFAGYHFAVLVAPVALTAGCGAVFLVDLLKRPRLRTRLITGGIGLVLVFSFTMEMRAYYDFYRPDVDYALGRIDRASYWRSFDRGSFSYAEHCTTTQYLKRHTNERDAVLVWGLAPGIYYLADRKAATKYVFHQVLLTNVPLSRSFQGLRQRRTEFMERLKRIMPAYILIGLQDPNGFEPLDSYSQMLHFPVFREYVHEGYVKDRRIGHFLLMRRKDRAPTDFVSRVDAR